MIWSSQGGKSATPGMRTPLILPSYSSCTPCTPPVLPVPLLYSSCTSCIPPVLLYSSCTPCTPPVLPVLLLYSLYFSCTPPVLRLYFTSYYGVLESRFSPLGSSLRYRRTRPKLCRKFHHYCTLLSKIIV